MNIMVVISYFANANKVDAVLGKNKLNYDI